LRLTLRRSTVGTNPSARGTVRALGLHRIGQTVELRDDVATRGQVRAVRYLLDVEEVLATPADQPAAARSAKAQAGTSRPARRTTTPTVVAAPTRRRTAAAPKKETPS
jgi:large subunit ribosomal protein L30